MQFLFKLAKLNFYQEPDLTRTFIVVYNKNQPVKLINGICKKAVNMVAGEDIVVYTVTDGPRPYRIIDIISLRTNIAIETTPNY
jgi:hypothetical protein